MPALIYFGLPILFPSLEEDTQDLEDKRLVIRSKYKEFNTESFIFGTTA
ncbi:MAG: hypothetical protein ACTSWY_10610 [Promethearchaeota archaeon]